MFGIRCIDRCRLIAGVGLFAFATTLEADIKVEHVPYHGWNNAIRISNGTVDLVVVPSVGRVMFYGYSGHENVLWENAKLAGDTSGGDSRKWVNFGGDKVWMAPQSGWQWPPDATIDAGPYDVELLANGVRLTSQPGRTWGIKVSRDIKLAQYGTEVEFTNRVTNLIDRRKLAVWQVTQINSPSLVTLDTRVTHRQPRGFYLYSDLKLSDYASNENPRELHIRRDPKVSHKYGSTSQSGIIKCFTLGGVFQSIQENRTSVTYPDQDSAQQVYTNPDPWMYAEAEQCSQIQSLESGEVAIQTVKWRLGEAH